jgi:hypothetical protein
MEEEIKIVPAQEHVEIFPSASEAPAKTEPKPEINLAKADEPPAKAKKVKKSFINSAWFPLLGFLLYGVSFMIVYSNLDPVAKDITNATILKIFTDYSIYVGWVLGLLSMVVMYVLFLIKKLVRLGWLYILNPIILAVSILPWFLMARQLVYFEKRYIDIAKGLITYLGEPLLWTSYIIFAFAGVWLLAEIARLIFKKK